LVIFVEKLVLRAILELQKQQILENSNILFVAVIRAPLVLAFLFIDDLHLFLEPDLLDNLLHLLLVVGICHSLLEDRGEGGVNFERRDVAGTVAEKWKSIVRGTRAKVRIIHLFLLYTQLFSCLLLMKNLYTLF
jgi:hypothetical protein